VESSSSSPSPSSSSHEAPLQWAIIPSRLSMARRSLSLLLSELRAFHKRRNLGIACFASSGVAHEAPMTGPAAGCSVPGAPATELGDAIWPGVDTLR